MHTGKSNGTTIAVVLAVGFALAFVGAFVHADRESSRVACSTQHALETSYLGDTTSCQR